MFCIATINGNDYVLGAIYDELDGDLGFDTWSLDCVDYTDCMTNAVRQLTQAEQVQAMDLALNQQLVPALGMVGTLEMLAFVPRFTFHERIRRSRQQESLMGQPRY